MSEQHTPGSQPGENGPQETMTALVAGLAAEVAELRRQLEPVDGLADRVVELANTVADLAKEVAEGTQRCKHAPAVSWLDLPDGADDREATPVPAVEESLVELAWWVSRVYLRYADAAKTFPDCWLYHPEVVEELTWLRHAWWSAYRVEGASPALTWDWHDRYRPGVVHRIAQLVGHCSLDNHTGERGPAAAAPVPITDGLAELAAWWATDRTSAPPPPTEAALAHAREAEEARLRDGSRR